MADAWIKTSECLPRVGELIVKRWSNGAVWAGRYAGTAKDSSFDQWVSLDAYADRIAELERENAELQKGAERWEITERALEGNGLKVKLANGELAIVVLGKGNLRAAIDAALRPSENCRDG